MMVLNPCALSWRSVKQKLYFLVCINTRRLSTWFLRKVFARWQIIYYNLTVTLSFWVIWIVVRCLKSPVISELCDIYGLHKWIDQPTYFEGTIPSHIDVIVVTNRMKYSGVLNCNCCVGDVHNFIGATTRRFALLRKPLHVLYSSYRNFNDADFCHAVSSAPFHISDIFDDVEDMAWFTSSLLSTIIIEHALMSQKYIDSKQRV